MAFVAGALGCVPHATQNLSPAQGGAVEEAELAAGKYVRVRLRSGERITGRLLEPFASVTDTLAICIAETKACDAPFVRSRGAAPTDTARPHTEGIARLNLSLGAIDTLWVHNRPVHGLLNIAVYSGMLAGGAAFRDGESEPSTGGMLLGLVVGGAVGLLLEKRADYWQQYYPCRRDRHPFPGCTSS